MFSTSDLKKSDEVSILIGMANVSLTENALTLTGPNQKVAASAKISGINGLLHYRFKNFEKISLFGQFSFPLMASEGTYLAGGAGAEYYFGEASSKLTLNDSITSLVMTPTMRYFAYSALNLAYVSYNTLTAKKNDTVFEIELGGGISRKFSKFSLRAQAGFARGVGVVSTTTAMKGMIGGIFFLD